MGMDAKGDSTPSVLYLKVNAVNLDHNRVRTQHKPAYAWYSVLDFSPGESSSCSVIATPGEASLGDTVE